MLTDRLRVITAMKTQQEMEDEHEQVIGKGILVSDPRLILT